MFSLYTTKQERLQKEVLYYPLARGALPHCTRDPKEPKIDDAYIFIFSYQATRKDVAAAMLIDEP
jgi:hypothetical protein